MLTKRNHLFIGFFSFGLIGVFGVSHLSWQLDDRLLFAFLLVPFSVICLVPAIVRLWEGKFDPFEPPVLMGFIYCLSFGLLSFQLLDREAKFLTFLGNDFHWLNMALLYLSIGLLVLWLGYCSRLALSIERMLHIDHRHRSTELTSQIVFFWGPILYAIGSIARIYLISTGTFGYLKAQYREVAEAQILLAHFLTHVRLFCSYALVIAAISYFTQDGARQRIIFYSILILEIFFGIISGYRTPILLAFFFVGVVYYYIYRKLPLRYIFIGFIILLPAFPIINSYRNIINSGYIDTKDTGQVLNSLWSIFNDIINEGGTETVIEGSQLASSRMNLIQNLASVLKFSWEHGTYPDRHLVFMMPLLTFVPRAVWPSKPRLELGYWFNTEVLGGSTISSVATTFIGALYLYFGFWGYLAAMFLVGAVQKFAYRRYSSGNSLVKVFFAPFVVLTLANPGSDFVSELAGLIQQLIVMMIISKLVFRRMLTDSSYMMPPRSYATELRHTGS